MAKPAAPPRQAAGPRLTPQEQRKQQAAQRQELANRLKPLKKELEQSERRMATLEQEKLQLEARLGAGLPPPEIAETGRKLKAATDELAGLEERWMALSGEIEAAEAGSVPG